MPINFNTTPYFDDYDEEKKFLKILYRPGYAVQTRELNQLQSIFQKQVDRFGRSIFKEGSMVIPGGVSLNTNFNYVKFTGDITSIITSGGTSQAPTTISNAAAAALLMLGKKITGETSGVTGIVKWYQLETATTPFTLFVEYDKTGNDNVTQVFNNGEAVSIVIDETDANNKETYSIYVASSSATGLGSAAEISRGVYFVKGHFALVEAQTLVLDAYANAPTNRVGLRVFESLVTPEQDETLNDNANGSFNYAAPGAHRYKIELILEKLDIGSTDDEDFIELLQSNEGKKELHVTKTEYSELGKELARRTYDESGDYTITPFRMTTKEARDNNRGQWVEGNAYLIGDVVTNNDNTYVAITVGNAGPTAPTHTFGDVNDGGVIWTYDDNPIYNGGHLTTGQENQVVIAIEPGKAYVRGYEIEKPSTTFIAVDKARDYKQINDDLVPTTIGNYVLTRSFTGVPDFTIFDSVNLLNSQNATIGTARIRGLEKDGTNYRLYLFAINLNDNVTFSRIVKTISNTSFSCEVSNVTTVDGQGSVSSSGSTVTGNGTRFTRDFALQDLIDIDGAYYRITTIANDTTLTVSGEPGATADAYKIHRSGIFDPNKANSIFPLSRRFIKSVKDETPDVDVPDLSYIVMQKVTKPASSNSLTIALSEVSNLTGVGSRIDPNTEVSEIIVSRSGGGFVTPTTFVVAGDDQSFTITGLTNSTTYTVFFPVIKNTSVSITPKTKTLQTYAIKDVTTVAGIEERQISLGKADVYRIRKVLMSATTGAFNSAGAVDITNYFELDDGQHESYYDIAYAIRKPNFAIPTGSIRIYFDYFVHSTTGDYFCVDSYTNVKRENIPFYAGLSLADCLDFRPRIADNGVNFTATGSALALPPKPGTSTQVDYTYYVPRVDKLALDIEGKFNIIKGTSGEGAVPPETPDLSMHMATIAVAAYTTNTQFVNVEKIDNRRYTMKDIGKLERRIESLEYYTSLSLLEQQASTLDIKDEFGLDRFKNGFIVDNFAGHTTGDVSSVDYRASIDMDAKELRPTHYMDNVNLLEQARTDVERSALGYQLTGDIITLPYEEKPFISQLFASRPENVNPFAIFTFIGSIDINPPSDEWIETRRIPEVINDIEGNFSAVVAAERASGALGTVWNAWQTQWTGTQVNGTTLVRVDDWSTQDFGLGAGNWQSMGSFSAQEVAAVNGTAGGRVITREVVANQNGQSRTGLNTEVRATFSKEFINDRVVSTSVVPFIRSRKIAFLARGLKLQTIVHAFFDEVNVSRYITPAAKLTYTGNALFDYQTNAGRDNDEKARRFNGNTQSSYNKGDVIFVKRRGTVNYASAAASIATAVCILQETDPKQTNKALRVINTIGEFLPGDIIGGSISGSQGTVTAWAPTIQGDSLVTNFGGDVAGVFDIPNTNAIKFKTGNREFKLIDNTANNDLIAKTRGFGNYRAEGVLQTWQSTFNSVRNAEIVRSVVSEDRTLIGDATLGRVIRDSGWYDPLAQTFLVQNRGGGFITSIDLFFASIDPLLPVTVQIRDVVNGYPGKYILPFSNVTLYPYELRDENQPAGYGLSSNTVTVEGGVWLAPNKPTKFKMKAPVYVQDVGEYCIVILSNSNNYNVWTSELGGIDVTTATPRLISAQPYAGVLFKSQNASTWTAHQNEDLMFRVNIAEFDEAAGGPVFVNARVDNVPLQDNPFFIRKSNDGASGPVLVRVYQDNHGFAVGSKVTISGVATGSYNNIASSIFNATHTVLHVEHDAFVIRVIGLPTKTGRTGGSGVISTRNVQFDTLQPIIQSQNFADTSLDFEVKTTSGSSVNGSQTAGVLDSSYIPVRANTNNDFNVPRMIGSTDNETLYLSGNKSFYIKANMTTSNPSLSPVIDTARLSLITVNNRINNPTYSNLNFVGNSSDDDFDIYDIFNEDIFDDGSNTEIEFSGKNITSPNLDIQAIFKSLRPGKYINVTGAINAANNGDHLITAISDDGSTITTTTSFTTELLDTAGVGATIRIKLYDNFISEIAPNGSASAKYLTRKISLSGSAASSTNLSIKFTASIPVGSSVEVYYRVSQSGSEVAFEELNWTLLDVASTTVRSTDLSFSADNLPSFNTAAVKLVMKSVNSSAVPKVKDLIIIATA